MPLSRVEAHAQSIDRIERYLIALRNGAETNQTLRDLGMNVGSVMYWRKSVPHFRERELAARALGKSGVTAPVNGIPDLLTFRENHFAYLDKRNKRWVRAVNNWYQMDAYAKLTEHNRLIIVLPPGHIKTTFFGVELSTHSIWQDRNFRILNVQKNQGEAEKVIAAVESRLSEHDYYEYAAERLQEQGDKTVSCPICEYQEPPFKPNKADSETWGKLGFRVLGTTSGEKDLTMQALGVGSQIQGIRADRIILDDIQDPELAVKSPKDSEDKLGWLQRVILGRITDYQQLVVLANFFSPDDFAHRLIAETDWPVINYPALVGESKDVLCPEFHTKESLEAKRKEVGEQTWHFTWMQEEGSFDEQTFKRDVLEAARDDSCRLGEVPHAVTHVFLGVDPATAPSGFCAIVAWGLDVRSGQRFLIDVFNKKGMRTQQNVHAQILEFVRNYHPRIAVIEGNAQQKSLAFDAEFQRQMRSLGCRVELYQTVTGTGARAERSNFDITTIGGLFDAGLITLPYSGTYEERQRVDDYIAQLCAWRTGSDGSSLKNLTRDMVMATLFAESEAHVQAIRPLVNNPIPRGRPVPAFAKNARGGWRWQRPAEPQWRKQGDRIVWSAEVIEEEVLDSDV